MWALHTDAAPFAQLPVPGHGGVYTVGRKDGDITLPTFKSVSRRHAEFRLGDGGRLEVVDVGSSFGTKVNGEALTKDVPREVAHGDVLTIGTADIHVSGTRLAVCCSAISKAHTRELTPLVEGLGGEMLKEWTPKVRAFPRRPGPQRPALCAAQPHAPPCPRRPAPPPTHTHLPPRRRPIS